MGNNDKFTKDDAVKALNLLLDGVVHWEDVQRMTGLDESDSRRILDFIYHFIALKEKQ